MKRKSTFIICAAAVLLLAALLFSAIRFGPKPSLKRELNISIPENAEIVKYDAGFLILGPALSRWKIKLDPEQYPAFREALLNSLSEHSDYKYFDDIYDSEDDHDKHWLRTLYEKTYGFSGYYDTDNELQWSACGVRGKEPPLTKTLTYIHAVATLSEDGYYYVSIVLM